MPRAGLGLLLVALAGPAQAEPLSLEGAIRMALEHSPRIEAARARTEAAAAEATASGRARWPHLGVELGAHRSNDPVMVFGDLLHQGRFTSGDLGVFDPAAGSFDLSGLIRSEQVKYLLDCV
jgi:outer membrane protein TolC